MFIQTEDTPNPATLKFLPQRTVSANGSIDFPNKESASRSPLAQELFAISGIEAVFFGQDYISITKNHQAEWLTLKPALLTVIMTFFLTHFESDIVLQESDVTDFQIKDTSHLSELELEIIGLLDTKIRPFVAQDGGDIVFDHFEDGVVYVKMQGACSGCPSSTATLKSGIENMLRHYIPDIKSVEAV